MWAGGGGKGGDVGEGGGSQVGVEATEPWCVRSVLTEPAPPAPFLLSVRSTPLTSCGGVNGDGFHSCHCLSSSLLSGRTVDKRQEPAQLRTAGDLVARELLARNE